MPRLGESPAAPRRAPRGYGSRGARGGRGGLGGPDGRGGRGGRGGQRGEGGAGAGPGTGRPGIPGTPGWLLLGRGPSRLSRAKALFLQEEALLGLPARGLRRVRPEAAQDAVLRRLRRRLEAPRARRAVRRPRAPPAVETPLHYIVPDALVLDKVFARRLNAYRGQIESANISQFYCGRAVSLCDEDNDEEVREWFSAAAAARLQPLPLCELLRPYQSPPAPIPDCEYGVGSLDRLPRPEEDPEWLRGRLRWALPELARREGRGPRGELRARDMTPTDLPWTRLLRAPPGPAEAAEPAWTAAQAWRVEQAHIFRQERGFSHWLVWKYSESIGEEQLVSLAAAHFGTELAAAGSPEIHSRLQRFLAAAGPVRSLSATLDEEWQRAGNARPAWAWRGPRIAFAAPETVCIPLPEIPPCSFSLLPKPAEKAASGGANAAADAGGGEASAVTAAPPDIQGPSAGAPSPAPPPAPAHPDPAPPAPQKPFIYTPLGWERYLPPLPLPVAPARRGAPAAFSGLQRPGPSADPASEPQLPYLCGPGVPAFETRCPCPNCYAGPFVITANLLLGIVDPESAAFVDHQYVHIAGSPQVFQCSICQNFGAPSPVYFDSLAALVVHLQVHDPTFLTVQQGRASWRPLRPCSAERRFLRALAESGDITPAVVCPVCLHYGSSEAAVLQHVSRRHTLAELRAFEFDSRALRPVLRRFALMTDFVHGPLPHFHRLMHPVRDCDDTCSSSGESPGDGSGGSDDWAAEGAGAAGAQGGDGAQGREEPFLEDPNTPSRKKAEEQWAAVFAPPGPDSGDAAEGQIWISFDHQPPFDFSPVPLPPELRVATVIGRPLRGPGESSEMLSFDDGEGEEEGEDEEEDEGESAADGEGPARGWGAWGGRLPHGIDELFGDY